VTASRYNTIKSYIFPCILIASIILGGLVGIFFKSSTYYLKPLGDIFLNLIFTAIVPLIFFSVSSAIARTSNRNKLGTIFFYMTVIFIFTGLVAAIYSLFIVTLFPPAQGASLQFTMPEKLPNITFSNQIVSIFTVPDFTRLFSHEHILALILFSILVGLAVSSSKEKGTLFSSFLMSGEAIFLRVFGLIMYYAPIGFFAYFAVLVCELGPNLMESYLRIAFLYYISALLYFFIAFSAYAYLAAKWQGIKLFWGHVFLPLITSLATCSSAASIPANLVATRQMGVPVALCETIIPLGSIIHKDGSVIGGVFKIAFLFGIFHLDFSQPMVLLMALGISLLVGTVMGAIPSGGMLGELLIITAYGFPPSVLIAIAAISIIIDPLATMINVTGNSVSSMMISRLVVGKRWWVQKNEAIA